MNHMSAYLQLHASSGSDEDDRVLRKLDQVRRRLGLPSGPILPHATDFDYGRCEPQLDLQLGPNLTADFYLDTPISCKSRT